MARSTTKSPKAATGGACDRCTDLTSTFITTVSAGEFLAVAVPHKLSALVALRRSKVALQCYEESGGVLASEV